MGSRIQGQEISQNSKQEQDLSNKQTQVNTKAGLTSSQKLSTDHVGHLWKKIVLNINDGTHAQMLAKLRYDSLKQKEFFKKIISAYLEDNPIMRDLIIDFNKEKINKTYKKKMQKDFKEKNETTKDFALNELELESIFDAIEKENPEI